MLDELLGDLFERDQRESRQRGPERRGIRGLLDRLFGGDDEDHRDDRHNHADTHRRDQRRRERESPLDWD